MQRRLPKRGFKNINRVEFVTLNLDRLQQLVDRTGQTTLDVPTLVALGVARQQDKIKVLGRGTLSATVNLSVHAVSQTAKQAIEALGGTVQLV
jgi:large subunit ribosomal protein L15